MAQWRHHGLRFDNYTGDLINHNDCPAWARGLAEGLGLDDVGVSLYKMAPGRILPGHIDTYKMYKKVLGIDHNRIFRIVVFLEDWQSGHYFEIDGCGKVNWKKGDYVYWKGDTEHMAANLGLTKRYTLQITGHK